MIKTLLKVESTSKIYKLSLNMYIYPQTRVSSFPGLMSVAQVNE